MPSPLFQNQQHRTRLLRHVDAHGDWRSIPGLWDAFENRSDLLGAAQRRWFTVLGAAIDFTIERGEGALAEDIRHAYQRTATRHPGLRRLLDEHEGHPAIAKSVRRERALIACAAGVEQSSQILCHVHHDIRAPEPRLPFRPAPSRQPRAS